MWCQQKRQICARAASEMSAQSMVATASSGVTRAHLVATRTWLEVGITQVDLLETERTFEVFLRGTMRGEDKVNTGGSGR